MRYVGVGNFVTQTVLKPLHQILMDVLHTLPTDYTFRQNEGYGPKTIARFKGRPAYSLDLSAATDRLPLTTQKVVLESVCGLPSTLVESWGELMSQSGYITRLNPGEDYVLRYAVGQPMGLYRSWATMALTHHVLVQMSAILAGHTSPFFSDYVLLGDDIVIFDRAVAKEYK